jgi:hypothetical protein
MRHTGWVCVFGGAYRTMPGSNVQITRSVPGEARDAPEEKRLLAQGFQRANQEWLTAWDVTKKPASTTP